MKPGPKSTGPRAENVTGAMAVRTAQIGSSAHATVGRAHAPAATEATHTTTRLDGNLALIVRDSITTVRPAGRAPEARD